MSRFQNMHIFNVHIADGFYEDCEDLVQHCLRLETLNFITFSGLWKDMNFRCIYLGRSSGEEVAELSEELILIAKRFMLKDAANFKEAIAGLFIVYALLTQQPYPNFAWLRVTPDDLPAIKRLKNAAQHHRQCDALYILGTILIKHTHYHATERERGFDSSLKKYLDGCLNLNKNGMRPMGIFQNQNDVSDMIKELGTIARRYTQCRDRVSVKCKETPCKKYVNENLPTQFAESLKKIINGYDMNDIAEGEDRHTSVQSIKQRAMATAVNSVPHLTTTLEKKEKSTPLTITEVQSGKVKFSSSKPQKSYHDELLERKPLRPAAFFAQLHDDHDDDLKLNFSKAAKKRNKTKTTKDNSESKNTDESENSETEKLSLKPIRTYTKSKTKITDKEDVTDESNNECNQRPAKKIVYENTKKSKPSKSNTGDIKGNVLKKSDTVNKITKESPSVELISESDDSDMEKPIKRQKVSKDLIPGIVHTQSGETECEIEIIDYAKNIQVPVHTILKDILQQNETTLPPKQLTNENT